VGQSLALTPPQLTRALLSGAVRQPFYLASPARGLSRWRRGGSRTLHISPSRLTPPLHAIGGRPEGLLVSMLVCGVSAPEPSKTGLRSSLVLDRGFFFPNRYRQSRPQAMLFGRTAYCSSFGVGARGRAGFLSRSLGVRVGRLRYLGAVTGPAGVAGVRLRKRLMPTRVPYRRKTLGAL
jgi:hypothetical protein